MHLRPSVRPWACWSENEVCSGALLVHGYFKATENNCTIDQVELGKVNGFWSVLQTATSSVSQVFECWAASSYATDTGKNQLWLACDDDVTMSYWVRSIGLRHLQFLHQFPARTLYVFKLTPQVEGVYQQPASQTVFSLEKRSVFALANSAM